MFMRFLYIVLSFSLCAVVSAQTNCYNNASLEGTSQSHQVPSPWNTCWGSPDTQPGQWGFTQPASHGNTYVSFLATNNYGYLEGMTQPLTTCMVAGQTYTFTVDLAHSNVYSTAEPGNCYSSIAVWGGNSACQRAELLYCSGEIWHTNWQTYTITFTPSQNWCFIGFSPCYLTSCSGYINLMLDNISCIEPASTLVTATDVTCYGYCNGTATADPITGIPPFTYLWSTGATTQSISGLCIGDYWVIVTDNAGTQAGDTVTVSQPAQLTVNTTVNTSPCTGASNGSATATPSGDAPPFTYLWSPSGATTTTATGLSAGTHTVTVTDTSGCTVVGNITINALPLPPANAGPNQNICIGQQAPITASGGTAYAWSSGQNTASFNVSPTITTTYIVTVTGANGCTASDDVIITVFPLPIADAGTDQIICIGQSANFTATGGVSYAWSNSANTANINVSPNVTTTYTVTVTDANSCSATDNAVLTVNPLPPANAGTDIQECYGNDAQLNASGGNSYLWTPSTGLNHDNIANPIAQPLQTSTYTVQVTDANGCINTDNMVFTVWPLPPASAGANQVICEGQTANITASGGMTYLWNTNDNTNTINVSPTATTTYTVTVTDANGCSETANMVLTVNYPPPANAGNDTHICYGLSTTLNATGGVNYQWSPASGLSSTTIANPIANPTSPTTYTVTVTDAAGCSATDNVAIGIYPAPTINFSASPLNGCEPLTVQFTDNTTPTIQYWAWDFGNYAAPNNASNIQNPLYVYQNAGTFSVTLSVTTTDNCIGSLTLNNYIEVYPNPVADFLMSPAIGSIDNPIVYFEDVSTLATSWSWNFGDPSTLGLNYSSIPNPQHTYLNDGSYLVTLMVQSQHGCTDTVSKNVIIKPTYTLYIPNVFTPNGDGINDIFQAFGTNIIEYEMFIFNRWGEQLFYTQDYNLPWDGKVQTTGETYMQDVYVYKIIIRDLNGKRRQFFGHVTLLN